VRDILRSLAAAKRIRVKLEVAENLGEIVVDPAKLKQVLYNYLSNALKFTPDEGRVTIRVLPEGADAFRLEVEDSGIGMREEDIPRLFVEFQQLDASSSKKYAGTGLGLALSKRIVEAQGGLVGVRSALGRGSTFFAVLPRRPGLVAAVHREEPAEAEREGAPAVLVVEDNPSDQRWLRRTLVEAGYNVETVSTGAAAVARARERVFDAITLDLLLPDMGGHEVLKAIRAQSLNERTPVIVVTVVSERGAAAGYYVVDILSKPVNETTLLRALRGAHLGSIGQGPVLVVDDDPASIKLAEKVLRGAGYRTIGSTSGPDGLRQVTEHSPTLVVLDLLMPGMNGFEFLAHLRRGGAAKIPVIIWTSKSLDADERSRLMSQAQAVVLKSDGAAGLLEEIRLYAHRPAGTAEDSSRGG